MEISEDMAEIMGAFAGDGWIESREKGFYILGDPLEDKEYYDTVLAPLFSKEFSTITPKQFSSWRVYGLASYKKKDISLALKYGFVKGSKAKTISVPKEILISKSLQIKIAFLRGLFDTDGSFYCDKARGKYANTWRKTHHHQPRIDFQLASKQLIYSTKQLLEQIGIDCAKIYFIKSKETATRKNNTQYKLSIHKKEYIKLFFKNVESNNPRQKTKYEIWQKYGFVPPKTSVEQRKEILAGTLDPNTLY
ncbi:hypothetical protein GF358_02345 [Candidatus Woesearchaeota archaeon]|nr:hypothetical protein [Candidatus Woesearchaeota archaeon]